MQKGSKRKGRKMKKVLAGIVIFCMVFSAQAFAQPPAGQEPVTESNAYEKLQRGFLNLADAVVEVPGTMMRKSKKEGVVMGVTAGLFEGVLNTVKRALAGAWEVASFPIPLPEHYAPMLPDPEFLNTD
jgi:putative exosortase-associated protein (TIGR04073 family)